MKPTLVVGLGNPLAGDDGVGYHVADRLLAQPYLPPDVEVVHGGTDLLRLQPLLAGRRRVVLVDALLDDGPPGRVRIIRDLEELDDRAPSAHHLSPAAAVRLLRTAVPGLDKADFLLLGITVTGVEPGAELSPEASAGVAAAVTSLVEVGGFLSLTP